MKANSKEYTFVFSRNLTHSLGKSAFINHAGFDPLQPKLNSPAFIENDRTYLPLRFAAENLGAEVGWVEETKQVVITKALPEKATTK